MITRRSMLLAGVGGLLIPAAPHIARAGLIFARTSSASTPGTTWNPADLGTGITLSNANLTASRDNSDVGSWRAGRSTNVGTARTSGKYHAEFTVVAVDGTNTGLMFGTGTSDASLAIYLGTTNYSIGLQPSIGAPTVNIFFNGSFASRTASLNNAVGDVWAMEVDITAELIWFQNITKTSGWTDGGSGFTGNPGAGTGGTSIATMPFGSASIPGAYLMMAGTFTSSVADTITMNPGPTFALAPSTGFVAWDASGGGGGPVAGSCLANITGAGADGNAGLTGSATALANLTCQ